MAVRGIHLVLFLLILAGVGLGLVFGIRSGPEPESAGTEAGAAVDETRPDMETSASAEEAPAPDPAREELPQADVGSGTSVPNPPPDSAPLRGLLTDAATGEALPFYLLRVTDGSGRREDLFTDEQGRFASASPTPSGTIRIQPMDTVLHPRSLPEIVREHRVTNAEAPDVDLSIASGPTFRLSISPPDAVPPTEFRARLFLAGNASQRTTIDDEPVRTPLSGEAPWVRFAPVAEDLDHAERIELQSRDGLWVGGGKAAAVRGVAPDLVQVMLESRAVLEGRVVDTAGAVVPDTHLTLVNDTSKGKVVGIKQTDKDGRFRFDALREGSGTLTAKTLRHKPQEANVRLPAGFVATQDFVLEKLGIAGDIRGRVESETGTYAPDVEVTLSLKEIGSERARVRWEEIEGRKVGLFEFTALPAGNYAVRVEDDSWLRWETRTLTVSPPSSEARFVVHDSLALADFAFRARDADNGAKLDGVLAALDVVKEHRGVWRKLSYETPVLERFPLELHFAWRLDLEGYRPAVGDEKAFSLEETRDGRVWRFAEVDLERGWQETFRILGGPKRKPLSGATVRLDGREAGTSGKDGLVTARSPEKPRLIEVIYRDWKPTEPVVLRPVGRRGDPEVVKMLAPAN